MKRAQKIREKIRLTGTPKYTLEQKIGWVRHNLKQAFDIQFHESDPDTHPHGTTEVTYTFVSPTGVVIGTLGSLFGMFISDESPILHDSCMGSRTGMFLEAEVVAILTKLMQEFTTTFFETELDKEWRDKQAAREYGEKYGFSLYQVYDYCVSKGLDPQKLFDIDPADDRMSRRALNDGIRSYRPREYTQA